MPLAASPLCPRSGVHTTAKVHLEKAGAGFTISRIELECEAEIPGIDEATFQEQAKEAKANCPVSKALGGTEISLTAKLLRLSTGGGRRPPPGGPSCGSMNIHVDNELPDDDNVAAMDHVLRVLRSAEGQIDPTASALP